MFRQSAVLLLIVSNVQSFVIPRPTAASSSSRIASSLHVSIGLGPEKDPADVQEKKELVAGVDYEIPNHEEHRLDRRSKLDEQCDEWFAKLLAGETSGGALKGKIAETVYQQLITVPELVNDVELPIEDEEWTPYMTTKLPWSVIHPAYGLEQFGLPIPRRNAETWRHFDVTGMVNTVIDGSVIPKGADITDDDINKVKQKLQASGGWLEDDECSARLIYINGIFAPELSLTTDAATNLENIDDDSTAVSPEIQAFMMHLTDGWTDELVCPVPVQQGDSLTSFSKLSGPNHNVGAASSQFAINTQQGTACFAALNTVKCKNIAFIHQTEPAKKDDDDDDDDGDGDYDEPKPVLIINALTPDAGVTDHDSSIGVACHPRTVIVAEKDSQLSVVQQTVDLQRTDRATKPRPILSNGFTQVLLKDNANVTHCIVDESGGLPTPRVESGDDKVREQEANRAALKNTVLENLDVHCAGTDSHYKGTVLSLGANGRARMAASITLLKPGASCSLNGFSLAGGTCRTDIKTNIHHIADGCESQQLQKNMVGGRATTAFRGRIRVEQSGQQTDSQQLSRTVLLSDKARAWAVPSLEIIADDVQCTHGATVADLSEEELFYLRSRGLDVAQARNLLMYAFCNDAIEDIPAPVLGTLESADSGNTANDNKLRMRILRRLENLVPTGERAVKGEFQSI